MGMYKPPQLILQRTLKYMIALQKDTKRYGKATDGVGCNKKQENEQ